MNPLIPLKGVTPLFFIALALLYFAVLPQAQSVVPPPDGGYPGFNTVEGQKALFGLTTGVANTAVGWYSLFSNTDGSYNTGVGAGTLLFNIGDQTTGDGTQNTAIGAAALLFNTTGFSNTAAGVTALLSNTTGVDNTATGTQALFNNTTGSFNTANGAFALPSNATGDNNTAIGFDTLANNTTGSSNIALGLEAGFHVTTADNVICIGELGENVSNSCYIGQIFGATSSGGTAVFINSDGRLGTTTSSRRFKEEIKPMERASEALFALKPVTFHYKSDKTNRPEFGLIAEEVAAVNPNLVVRDEKGEIYTVRYEAVNAMLLNEFLKEHRKVGEQECKIHEQEATITQLKKDFLATVAQLATRLDEQASQIQKVSAELEATKFATGRIRGGGPAPQVVTTVKAAPVSQSSSILVLP